MNSNQFVIMHFSCLLFSLRSVKARLILFFFFNTLFIVEEVCIPIVSIREVSLTSGIYASQHNTILLLKKKYVKNYSLS